MNLAHHDKEQTITEPHNLKFQQIMLFLLKFNIKIIKTFQRRDGRVV